MIKASFCGAIACSVVTFASTAHALGEFTCIMDDGDGGVHLTLVDGSYGSYHGNDDSIENRLIWFEQNGVVIIVGEADPGHFLVSFDRATGTGLMPYESGSLISATCTEGHKDIYR